MGGTLALVIFKFFSGIKISGARVHPITTRVPPITTNIEIQNFEPRKMARVKWLCVKISEYPLWDQ